MLRMLWPVAVVAALAAAEPAPDKAKAPEQERRRPAIERIGPHTSRVGSVVLNSAERSLVCPGRVNMDAGGPIELLACTPGGKVHESVFTLSVQPRELQVALLLLGLREGRNPAVELPEDAPEPTAPPGDALLISVEWTPPKQDKEGTEDEATPVAGKPAAKPMRRVAAEQFLYNRRTKKVLAQAEWVFLGSRLLPTEKDSPPRFGAEVEGSLITTYHDPLAILELAHPTVNDDIFYRVHEELCPPRGTPVRLIIRVPEKPADDAAPDTKKREGSETENNTEDEDAADAEED